MFDVDPDSAPDTAPHYQARHRFAVVLNQDPPLFVLRGVHEQRGPALGAAAEGKRTYPILQVVMIVMVKMVMIIMMMM